MINNPKLWVGWDGGQRFPSVKLCHKNLLLQKLFRQSNVHKNTSLNCRGLTAEEELVLMQMLDVKMFLKKEALKEQITSVRKKSLSSVSSLSQGLFYPSIFQVGL